MLLIRSARATESVKAEEDAAIYAALDKLARPCSECGLTSGRYLAGGRHESSAICSMALAEAVLES